MDGLLMLIATALILITFIVLKTRHLEQRGAETSRRLKDLDHNKRSATLSGKATNEYVQFINSLEFWRNMRVLATGVIFLTGLGSVLNVGFTLLVHLLAGHTSVSLMFSTAVGLVTILAAILCRLYAQERLLNILDEMARLMFFRPMQPTVGK